MTPLLFWLSNNDDQSYSINDPIESQGESFNENNNNNNDNIPTKAQTSMPDPNAVKSLMAKEMTEMSTTERERAYFDIHGVSQQAIQEDEEFMSKCLFETQLELNKIRKKEAYEIALSQSRDYAGGKELFLMFLRSNNFDPKETATQIVTHFEFKRLYFGDGLLGRPILYTDLDADDLVCLKCGWIQSIPYRDNSGRSVIFFMMQFMPNMRPFSIMRATWYNTMILLEYEEFQKQGFVSVVTTDETVELNRNRVETLWHLSRCRDSLPLRMAASHFCTKNTNRALQLVSFINNSWGKNDRARCRIHHGTQTEWMYSLLTFGIPVEHAPITNGGQMKTKIYREYIAGRKKLELQRQEWAKQVAQSSSLSSSSLLFPSTNNNNNAKALSTMIKNDNKNRVIQPYQGDVLLGSGSVVQKHAGNQMFYYIVDQYRQEYQQEISKKKKNAIAQCVLAKIQHENIRCLRPGSDDACWYVIHNNEEIIKRIMGRLRSKSLKKNNDNIADKRSSTKNRLEESRDCNNSKGEEVVFDNDFPSFLNQTGEFNYLDSCNCIGGGGGNARKRPRNNVI